MTCQSCSAKESPDFLSPYRIGVLALIIVFPLLVGNATTLMAQSRFPIVLSGGAHALTVPWYPGPVTDHLNPALTIGTERTLKSGDHVRWYQTANVGFFQHHWWMTGVFLNTELGAGRTLPLGFNADLRLGLGYLHYFWRRKSLELKNGRYVSATDWGRPSIMVPLSFVLGYRGRSDQPLTVTPFVSAQWTLQTPFVDELPVMTHLLFFVGVRIDRGNTKPTNGR